MTQYIIAIILVFTVFINDSMASENSEILFQKSQNISYKDYPSYLKYIQNTGIGKNTALINIYKHRMDVMIECGNKYKHLRTKDFINATQDCLWKWKQYWNCTDCDDSHNCSEFCNMFMFISSDTAYQNSVATSKRSNIIEENFMIIKGFDLSNKDAAMKMEIEKKKRIKALTEEYGKKKK